MTARDREIRVISTSARAHGRFVESHVCPICGIRDPTFQTTTQRPAVRPCWFESDACASGTKSQCVDQASRHQRGVQLPYVVTCANLPARRARSGVRLKNPPVSPSLCLRNSNADRPAFFVPFGQQGIRDLDGLGAYDWRKVYHRMRKIALSPGHRRILTNSSCERMPSRTCPAIRMVTYTALPRRTCLGNASVRVGASQSSPSGRK